VVKYKGTVIAEWKKNAAAIDTGGHLHLPAPEAGAAGDYEVFVELKSHGKTAATDHNYSLAWWTG